MVHSKSRSKRAPTSQKLLAFGFKEGPERRPVENFHTVISDHPFLFRVHHGSSHVKFVDDTGFIARRYQSGWMNPAADRDYARLAQDHRKHALAVYRHLLNEGNTPFISTTFNLAWTLLRAALLGKKRGEGVEITIIDASQVSSESFFALEILYESQKNSAVQARLDANAAQEVLVPIRIPSSAIISKLSWTTLEQNLFLIPRWFKRTDGHVDGQTFYLSTREFMRRARSRFKEQNISQDSAIVDAVTFAITLLGEWIKDQGVFPWNAMSKKTRNKVVRKVSDLAFDIVRWPSLNFPSEKSCAAQKWELKDVKSSTESLVRQMLSNATCPSIFALIEAQSSALQVLARIGQAFDNLANALRNTHMYE